MASEQRVEEDVILRDLLDRHGPLMTGDSLRVALGYPSMSAMRQALSRKRVPVAVFTPKGRRGKFALTHDVAHWLACQREGTTANCSPSANQRANRRF